MLEEFFERLAADKRSRGNLLVAAADGAILAGPVGARPPTLDGGEWTTPKTELVSERESSPRALMIRTRCPSEATRPRQYGDWRQ